MKFWSYDTETTGLNPYKDKMFAFSLCDQDGNSEAYRLDGKDNSDSKIGWKRLKQFWADKTIGKVCHNLKFDLAITLMTGIEIPDGTVYHDTMIMSRNLNNLNPSHELGHLAWQHFGWDQEHDELIEKMGKQYNGYQNIPIIQMEKYQHDDAQRTIILFNVWYEEIYNDPLLTEDYVNEIELILVTQRMEQFGIDVDIKNCNRLITWLEQELQIVQQQTAEMFKEYINWGSGDQVGRFLYRRLGLPILEYTEDGKPSTDKDILLHLRKSNPHPVYDLIFKHRSYTSGLAHIRSYLKLADENGIIRPNINTNQARTGRQASNNPNTMNFQKEEALKNPFPVPARKCFKARYGHILLMPDYKGIEMRLIVDACGEEELMEVINKDGDVHALGAEMFFGERFLNGDKAIKKVLRSAAKNASFAVAYGAGLGKVALTLNESIHIAKQGLDRYRGRFPRIANFTKQMSTEVKEQGYISTAFGRKLYIPVNKSYIGANYRIQHDAAKVLKHAEVKVDNYSMKKHNYLIRLVNPIHDELVIAYPRILLPELHKNCFEMGKLMTNIPQIKVKLEVEWKKTILTWNDAEEFQLRLAA